MSDKHKILILDDEPGIVNFMGKILSLKGFEVIGATNAKQALELFSEHLPKICILDVHLSDSDMDGIEVLQKLKQISPDVMCIMITRITDEEKVEQAQGFGAIHYLLKPLDTKEILKYVNEALCKIS